MTVQHKEPDFDEAMKICRRIMEDWRGDDKFAKTNVEIRMQRLAVALGRNPALVYPDYDKKIGPDYWYLCTENNEHEMVFSKSRDDWVCPHCHL